MPDLLRVTLVAFCLAVGGNCCVGSDPTRDPPRLEVNDAGQVVGMSVKNRALAVTPAPLITLCDPSGKQHVCDRVSGKLDTDLVFECSAARLRCAVRCQSLGSALEFQCRVQGEGPAQGLLLRVAFPFDAVGWQWHNDVQSLQAIAADRVYENVTPLKAWADLPEWRGQPDLRMGYCNRNFCTVITGPVGLCLAVPIDQPCTFRTAYHGPRKALEIVYDFALSPQTRVANQERFSLVLYACDPQWGFRDALARYYGLFPQLFKNHVPDPGQWMAFGHLSHIDNANEFCFGLQEGAPEPEYDDQLGVRSATYFTHAGMGANLKNYDPEKDPLPPYDVQVQAVEEAFYKRTGLHGMYDQVGLHDVSGKLDVRKWKVYAHLIAQFNLDPQLPYGQWTLAKARKILDEVRQQKGAQLDGFYYDGLSTGINYRTDHFRTAGFPCLWDPVANKPLLNNFYSSCQFARAAAEMLRPLGRITMMNGALNASFYVAPWLDLLGAETGLRIPREQFNYIRATTYHKPFLTLLKGNYEQKLGHPEIELYMKRCLAYGVLPGFFDWPPSGLGPGGKYWDHARYYERDRDLHRKYLPLCRALAAAGWEPVTHARTSDPQVYVERFGPAAGVVWLTALREQPPSQKAAKSPPPEPPTPHAKTCEVTIDLAALGLDDHGLGRELITDQPVTLRTEGGQRVARLDLPDDGVALLQLGSPPALARWRLEQAVETLDRGVRMRQLDRDKPPVAVHWRPLGLAYERGQGPSGSHMVLESQGQNLAGATQWAMLFQEKPADLTLRVSASADQLEAGKSKVGVECRLAWVTASYTHYETRFFELPAGSYAWKDLEFRLQSSQALRAIQIKPLLPKSAKGKLRLARISLADASRDEYLIDPQFAQWYESLPQGLGHRWEEQVQSLRKDLATLAADLSNHARSTERLAEVRKTVQGLQGQIRKAGLENACRRLLRDLETVQRHLEAL